MNYKYAFFDGDNVGNTIEILLLEGKVSEAQLLSDNINKAIQKIKKYLTDKAEVILAGGDDVLIKVKDDELLAEKLTAVTKIFSTTTGLTISCGVDKDIEGAIYQLSIAKLYGKNQIKTNKK